MARMKDCLDCVKTAKQRQADFDRIVLLAQNKANETKENQYVCKHQSTGDFFIATDRAQARRYPTVEVVQPVQ